jgi:CO/xanthine dehydrogenase Mo-binding subunit
LPERAEAEGRVELLCVEYEGLPAVTDPESAIDPATPVIHPELGDKGAGETGTAGALAALMNTINDVLAPLGAAPLTDMPFTPAKILAALARC